MQDCSSGGKVRDWRKMEALHFCPSDRVSNFDQQLLCACAIMLLEMSTSLSFRFSELSQPI